MKKYINKEILKNTGLIGGTIFLCELIFRVLLKYPIFDKGTLRIFLGLFILALLISILLSFTKRKWIQNTIKTITVLIATIYAIAQAGFQNYLGVFISLGTSSQLGAVKDYIKDYFDSFDKAFYLMLIPLILYLIYQFYMEPKMTKKKLEQQRLLEEQLPKNKKKKSKKKLEEERIALEKEEILAKTLVIKQRFVAFGVIVVGIGLYIGSIYVPFMQNKLQVVSNAELIKTVSVPNIAVTQFGTSYYGMIDIKNFIFPVEIEEKFEEEEIIIQEETDFSRIIDDTAWDLLLNDPNNNAQQNTLNDYFKNRYITEKNDYTGIFKDKNLVVVMLESVNNIILDSRYFPNMAKIYSEGMSFENAYSPRNSCSTGNNEMSAMISQFSIYQTCTANIYKENVYKNSIFGLFNDAGYNTTSYHNYTEQYYYRNEIHTNMGSTRYYGVQDLGIPYESAYQEWPSDVELVEKSYNIFGKNDKYMAFLTSVSPHQPYYRTSILGSKNIDLFADTDYSIELKRYMSKLKELDLALGHLMDRLKADGELDNTVIVLFADHYPYGLDNKDLNSYFEYNVEELNVIDKTPFVIYNSGLEGGDFPQYTSYINILPTLANMFELDYDPRLYVGTDLFSESYENRVIFADGSWEDEHAFYNAATSKIVYKGELQYSVEDIKKINTNITNRIKMSNLAIKTDYFNYLFNGLEKYEYMIDKTNPEEGNNQ